MENKKLLREQEREEDLQWILDQSFAVGENQAFVELKVTYSDRTEKSRALMSRKAAQDVERIYNKVVDVIDP